MSLRPAPAWLTWADYAHRGLHGPAVPENSLAAAEAAIAAGPGIACGIRGSGDAMPVMFLSKVPERLSGAPAPAHTRADALIAEGAGLA